VPLTTFLAARLATVSDAADEDITGSASEPVEGGPVQQVAAGGPAERVAAGERAERVTAGEPVEQELPLRPGVPQRRSQGDEVDVFADAKPFSADDEAESDWERRLRDSYGLDRLHPARRRPPE
jgi:hypothetical protein